MRHVVASGLWLSLLAIVAGCGPVQLKPDTQLPTPLVEKVPATVAVYFPDEFREYVHKEERYSVKYEISLGPAHVERLRLLLQAMFTRVVEVSDPAEALRTDPQVRMVIEPRFMEYAFLTPKDVAGEAYVVTIKYRFNLYDPQGAQVDSFLLTGYGRARSSKLPTTEPLAEATRRAMRDAGAKLLVEFTAEDAVRRLLGEDTTDALAIGEDDVGEADGEITASQHAAAEPAADGSKPPAAEEPVTDNGEPVTRPAAEEPATESGTPAAAPATEKPPDDQETRDAPTPF